ncbi:MAG: hypothetical protein HFJ36_06945 [Clostridia bacterium]|nr:hypothetical protein [Clostridia bacterium]
MEIAKIQLPKISFSSYQLIIKSLKYYMNSSTEFLIDTDLTMGICEMIDYFEKSHQVVKL